jgi:hypothetical protein
MPHVHFHDLPTLRPHCWLMPGVDLHTIADTRMSERYAHIKVVKQREALKRYSGNDGGECKFRTCDLSRVRRSLYP